jgi:hypothetical protein
MKVDKSILSAEATSFCQQHGVEPVALRAVELARKCFPSIRDIEIQLETNPETEEEGIVLKVVSHSDIEKVTEAYRLYVKDWVRSTTWQQRSFFRLSYTLA